MFCRKCGKQIPDGNRFCSFCGADAQPAQQPVGGSSASQPLNPGGSYASGQSQAAQSQTGVAKTAQAPSAAGVSGGAATIAGIPVPVVALIAMAVALIAAIISVTLLVTHNMASQEGQSASDSAVAVFGATEVVDVEADRPIVPSEAKDAPYEAYRVRIVEASDENGAPLNIFDYPQLNVRTASGFCLRDFSDSLPAGTYRLVATCNGTTHYLPPLHCAGAQAASGGSGSSASSGDAVSAALVILPVGDSSLTAEQASVQVAEEPARGKYAAFLEVLNQLQERYGEPEAQVKAAYGSYDAWACGLSFAQIVDFGDGVERLVAAYCTESNASVRPTSIMSYALEVYEYDSASDSAVCVFSADDALPDASQSIFFDVVSNGLEITDGGYTYLHITQDAEGKNYLMGSLAGSGGYYRFFGLDDSGSFALIENLEIGHGVTPELECYVDGEMTDEATWEAEKASYTVGDSGYALCAIGDETWAESVDVIGGSGVGILNGGGASEYHYSPATGVNMASELMDSLIRVTGDSDENLKTIGAADVNGVSANGEGSSEDTQVVGGESQASNASSISTSTYTNSRYGFSAAIPTSFGEGSGSANGDGCTFTDAATGMTITVYGSNNVLSSTLDSVQSDLASGHSVSYAESGDNWCVVSYLDGETIYYKKAYVGTGSTCTISFAYPESAKGSCDAIVEVVAPTFTPGDLSSSH